MVEFNNLPVEIQEKMLEEQVKQGNPYNKNIFIRVISTGYSNKGFDWEDSKDGYYFWDEILRNENINFFYRKYPNKKVYEIW